MVLPRFVILCTRNNTMLGINNRKERVATTSLGEASSFDSAEQAQAYLDGFHSRDLSNDCKVVTEGDILLECLGRDRAGWKKCDLKLMKQYCKKHEIVDEEYFRGRLPHIVALIENGDLQEAAVELNGARCSDEVRPYPKH